MTNNAEIESRAIDEKNETQRITSNSISAIIFSLDTLFPEESTYEKIDAIEELIEKYGLDNYSFSNNHAECLDSTYSINERVSAAIETTCNYIATAKLYLLQERLTDSWVAIVRANCFYGIAQGIKSTNGEFDTGTIKKNTRRATERSREGGIKKEAYKQIKRKEIIKALKSDKKSGTWKTPEEAAKKISSQLFRTLHTKNVPLPAKVETLEKHIIKLITDDTEVYYAYSTLIKK